MRIGALGVGQFRENWPYLVGPVACPAEAGVGGGCPLDAVMVAASYLAKKGSDGSMDEVRLFFLQREIYLGERCIVIVERVWSPTAQYMLAMKCISARFDSHDLDDTKFLIDYLKLRTPAEVFEIIQAYYPKRLIPAKTQFLIEEILPA